MKRAHGFSNAAYDCVQNDVLKHSLGKFRKNVAWFNQGWTRTRGSINCQPTLDRADEFLHFCGPQHLLLSPNRFSKFGLELDSDNGATILFENNTFLQDVERATSTVTKDLFALHFALPELKSRAIPIIIIIFSPALTGASQIGCPKWSHARVGIPSHVVSIGGEVQNTDRHLARVLYKFVKFHQ